MNDERVITILETLEAVSRPLGSGAVYLACVDCGLTLSEATAGRLLRDLERDGLVASVGRLGRIPTPRGREVLGDLQFRRSQLVAARHLASAVGGPDEKDLVDILVARRALEAEGAALAAVNATDQELARLQALAIQSVNRHDGTLSGKPDVDFHIAVASASHNKVLAAAVKLMRNGEPRFPILAEIRKASGEPVGLEHEGIVRAITQRDPDEARRLMAAHIERALHELLNWMKSRRGVVPTVLTIDARSLQDTRRRGRHS